MKSIYNLSPTLNFPLNTRQLIKSLLVLCLVLFSTMSEAQSSLKDIANSKKVYIGNIISNQHLDDPENFRSGQATPHLTEEYNTVVLENYMKMNFVLPSSMPENIHNLTVEELRETLTEDKINEFINNDAWTGLRKRGHAMIWFNQAPGWLNNAGPTWTGQQVFDFSRKYILALGQICGDNIDEWDVINEAISDDAPNGQRRWREQTWYRRANDGSMTDWGEATYENYIKMLFVWARDAQPNARLHINDYGIENFNNSMASKNRFMRDKVKALRDCGAPIDGVGFQSHLTLSSMVSPNGDLDTGYITSIEQSIQDLASEDIEVVITELDIRICNNDRDEDFQEVAFQAYCEMALSQPNCHEVLIWGLRDEDNWITLRNDSFFAGCEDAVIVEGDNYEPKAAYNGVASALSSLPDQNQYSLAPLQQGDGAPANCGGVGGIIPDILQIQGPGVVVPGEQVEIDVTYLATDNQDIVVWFQLNQAPFTVFSQTIEDVTAGLNTLTVLVEIPIDITPGNNVYRYLAFVTSDGGSYPDRFNELFQNGISVLGEDSQLIVSCTGPEQVSPGDSVEVMVRYSAVEDQEVVVWFQLDQPPFTTYQEFRQAADTGLNEIVVKLYIPDDVPLAEDAYQYQSLLVPTGGSWPDRVSNLSQNNVDVVMASSIFHNADQGLQFDIFPNPTIGECTIVFPSDYNNIELIVNTALGQTIQRQVISGGTNEVKLDMNRIPSGLYFVTVRQGSLIGTVKLLKE